MGSGRVGVRWGAGAVIALLFAFGAPAPASAGGLEHPAAGTRVLARGGAFFARPDSPMALLYNPANLAALPGIQLSLQANVVFYDACFNRDGTYQAGPGGEERVDPFFEGESAYGIAPEDEMPRVCNSGPPGLVPELVLTWRLHPMVGIGVGFVAPSSVGHTVWGQSGQIGERRVRGLQGDLPAPTRYALIEANLLVAFPTLGIGVAPHPRFRLGAAFGFGFGSFEFESIVRATRGEDFGGDVYSRIKATDRFIPRITVSAHAVPHDNVDVMVGFAWTDDVDASGDIRLQSGYYQEAVVETLDVPGASLQAPQPWQLAFAVRYADRIAPRPEDPDAVSRLSGRVEDAMANERWDIEAALIYERNSVVEDLRVNLPPCSAQNMGMSGCDDTVAPSAFQIRAEPSTAALPLPPDVVLPHNWKDSLSLRLGGSYSVLPGLAQVHLGFSYETKGVTGGFENIDFMPFQRFGAHVGVSLRVGRLDVHLAYAHIHQVAVTVTEGAVDQVNADYRYGQINCANANGGEACSPEEAAERSVVGRGSIINTGRYTSNFDILSLGLTYHFR